MTIHENTRRAILRDRRYGFKTAAIARMRRLPLSVVREVLREYHAKQRGWR